MTTSAEDIVAKTGELPPFPHVAAKVMKMVSDPKTSAKDLQQVIITDQALTARILKISNSAMFGLKREVRTLTHAITLLGFHTIRSIVIAAAAKNIYSQKKGADMGRKIWKGALGCALIARFLAEQLSKERINKEEAFIGGLMHNVGKTLLNTAMPEEYEALLIKAVSQDKPVETLEREQWGFDHRDMGSILLGNWNLSETLTEAVRCYNCPNQAPEACRKLTAVIGLAHYFCRDLSIGEAPPLSLENAALEPCLNLLNIDHAQVTAWRDLVRERVTTDMDMFQTI